MAEPFGDQDKGKRPAPTIEGTATEISVDPSGEEASRSETQDDKADEQPSLGAPASTEKETETPPPPPPRQRGARLKSFFSHLAAGLFGGLIAALALILAWSSLPFGKRTDVAASVSELEARVAELESAPAAPDNTDSLAALDARIKALEDRAPETAPELSQLSDRVTQLESTLKALAEAAESGGSVADTAALSEQISEVERRLEAKIKAALAEAELENGTSLEDIDKQILELRAKIGALAEAGLVSGDLSELEPEIKALEDRIAKLETALPDLADAIGKDAGQAKSATIAIAFANLRAAVTEGRPFTAELATLRALSPELSDLGPLETYADKGIPTLPELARSFVAAKDAALASSEAGAGDSFIDRLLASAQSLIKIRRVDAAASGDDASAVLARAEADLNAGKLAEAVHEVEKLEGPQRAGFTAWLDQAKARLGADDALKRLENLVLVSLGGSEAPAQDAQEQKQD